MKTTIQEITVRDLYNGYVDNDEEGVKGYYGKLDIRPAYQREFVYDEKKRNAVMDTINKGLFLGVFHWACNEDNTFGLLDGQQRTLSICQYVHGDYSINDRYFINLSDAEQNKILDFKILVCFCWGDENEMLDWFKTVNIAGEKLTDQELLNANYTGSWLSDAKRRFSKTNCVAYKLANKYVNGTPIRQDYLEIALKWISNDNIKEYMSKHQHDPNANELWLYFQSVIEWVKATFGEKNYRKEMKGLNWGELYNKYHNNMYDANVMEQRVNELMSNEEVTDKKGVYEYILSGEDKELACKLSKRAFSNAEKRTAYERQKGICPITGEWHPIEEMHADHIVPWWEGGTTTLDNLQMIYKTANLRKGGR